MNEPTNPAILALLGRPKPSAAPVAPEPPRPDAIYFDTNPLLGAGWPTPSAQLLQVMSQAEKLGFPLCLTEVVLQELEGHWIRQLVEEWGGVNGKIGNLNKYARSVVAFSRLPTLPAHDELRVELRMLAADLVKRFKTVPTTQRPLAEFVSLAINRGATFKEEGRGFQDSVILCSVVDDIKAHAFATAILVTNDAAFKSAGAAALVRAAGVTLTVVATLDELEGLLKHHFNSMVRDYYDQQHRQLMEALKQRLPDLENYVVENLTFGPEDLQVFGTIKAIESLQVIDIENAHEGFYLSGEQPPEPNRVRVSADVKIRLSLDIERFALPPSPRLKVGRVVDPSPEPSLNPFGLCLEVSQRNPDLVAVVEAEATRIDMGYADLRFTGTYLKRHNWGLGSVGTLVGGSE